MADQPEKEPQPAQSDSVSTILFDDSYPKPASYEEKGVQSSAEKSADSRDPKLPSLSIESDPKTSEAGDQRSGETEQEKEIREQQEKEKEVMEDPITQNLLSKLDRAEKSGKTSPELVEALKEFGQKSKDDPKYTEVLNQLLRQRGLHLSVGDSGITLSKHELLGGKDGIGHPAVPWGSTTTSINVPFDGSPASAEQLTTYRGSNPFTKRQPRPISLDDAGKAMFPDKRSNESRHHLPSRFDGQLYPYDGSGPKPGAGNRPHDAHRHR